MTTLCERNDGLINELAAANKQISELEGRLVELRQAAAIPEDWSHQDTIQAMIGLRYEGDALTNVCKTVKGLRRKLAVAEGLFNRWLMNEINHVFQNSRLQEDTKAFLTPDTPATEQELALEGNPSPPHDPTTINNNLTGGGMRLPAREGKTVEERSGWIKIEHLPKVWFKPSPPREPDHQPEKG